MQFINYICQIVNQPLEYPDILPCSYAVNFNVRPNDIRLKELPSVAKKPIVKRQVRKINKQKIIKGTDWRSRIK